MSTEPAAGQNLLWLRWFETIEGLRPALLEFQHTYSEDKLIERHGHRPPVAIRREQALNMQNAAYPKIPSQIPGPVHPLENYTGMTDMTLPFSGREESVT